MFINKKDDNSIKDSEVEDVQKKKFTLFKKKKTETENLIDNYNKPTGVDYNDKYLNDNKKANNVVLISKGLLEYGYVPNDRKFLESLPGVGRKTVNVVLSNLYNEPLIAVDTHVSRVSIRLGIAKAGDDVLTIEKKLNRKFPKDRLNRLHHQLVLFGRYYCKAINPDCSNCGLKGRCHK